MIKRLQFELLEKLIFKDKVVLVCGARQVGKTSLCKKILDKYSQKGLKTKYFNAEISETQEILNTTSQAKLKALIGIYDLVVIDEAQKIPEIGQILKILVDTFPKTQIITTGSSSFELANIAGEPLVGRSRKILMYPVACAELANWQDINFVRENIYEFIQYGLLPKVLSYSETKDKLEELGQITESYLYKDILKFEAVRKPVLLEKLVKLLAHQVGSEVSHNSLANTLGISSLTVEKYLDILQKSFIIYKLPPFTKSLKSEIKNKPKYYFYDTGVLNTLLDNYDLQRSDKYLGGVWENFVIIEKIKQDNLMQTKSKFFYWRNKGGAEIDLVVKNGDDLNCFEIKFNPKKDPKIPESFKQSYSPKSYKIISPASFWEELI
ncbi:MAG: ATP-binding protein [bacterium]